MNFTGSQLVASTKKGKGRHSWEKSVILSRYKSRKNKGLQQRVQYEKIQLQVKI